MTTPPLRPQPGILDIAPYVGGESRAENAQQPVLRLASNENPYGCSPQAMSAFAEGARDLHRYPDGQAHALRRAIAAAEGLDEVRIVCGAGSDELIALLIQAYAGVGDEVLSSAHSFLMYPIGALSNGAHPRRAPETNLCTDVDSLLDAVTARTKIVFVANPNNPTGSLLNARELRRLHRGLRDDILLVIDAAYAEYVTAPDYIAGAELVSETNNVVMTRTFSKIHGLAGLRLGWAFCPVAVADVLNRIRGPFNVSLPSQAAGIAALQDHAFIAASRAHNSAGKDWLSAELTKRGFRVSPSAGNFVLVNCHGPAEATAIVAGLKKQGILIRAMGAYDLPHCIRITIGRPDDNQRLVQAFDALSSSHPHK